MRCIIERFSLLIIAFVFCWADQAHGMARFTTEALNYLCTDSVIQAQITTFSPLGSTVPTRQLWLVADEKIPEATTTARTFTIVFCETGEERDFDTNWQVFYISKDGKVIYYCRQTLHDGIETIYFRKSHLLVARKSQDWTIASSVNNSALDEHNVMPYVPTERSGSMLMLACDQHPDLIYSYSELFSSEVQLYRQEHIFEGVSIIITDLNP